MHWFPARKQSDTGATVRCRKVVSRFASLILLAVDIKSVNEGTIGKCEYMEPDLLILVCALMKQKQSVVKLP